MRRATHHALYAFVNSNAMNGIDGATRITGGTPKFHYIMMGIDIGLSIIIVSCLGVIALNTLVFSPKRRKKLLDKGDIYEK